MRKGLLKKKQVDKVNIVTLNQDSNGTLHRAANLLVKQVNAARLVSLLVLYIQIQPGITSCNLGKLQRVSISWSSWREPWGYISCQKCWKYFFEKFHKFSFQSDLGWTDDPAFLPVITSDGILEYIGFVFFFAFYQ